MAAVAGDPLDEEEPTRLTWRGRESVFAFLDWWKRRIPGYEQAQVEQTGFSLGIRESRRVRGSRRSPARWCSARSSSPTRSATASG